MIEYIKGTLIEKNPAFAILDVNGMGYYLHVSINTFSALPEPGKTATLYVHQVIREDAHILFGFQNREERLIFRNLLSVNGVGASTARLILSSLGPAEVQSAINSGNVSIFQKIKGIGAKTAQRIIVDLSGKLDNIAPDLPVGSPGLARAEALAGLSALGFEKAQAEKALDKILSTDNNLTVEQLIKAALKNM